MAFDPWRCDDKNYRFGSVGEDRRLCLWDFSVGMLHRPRGGGGAGASAAGGRHGSIARGSTLGRAESAGSGLGSSTIGGDKAEGGSGNGRFTGPKPVEPRASTAMLPPVLTKVVDAGPLAWLEFTEEAIMTSSKSGMSLLSYFGFALSSQSSSRCPSLRTDLLLLLSGLDCPWERALAIDACC